jgi:hypothetical protein
VLCVLAFACVLVLGAAQVAMAQEDPASPAAPDAASANPVVNVAHFAPFASAINDTSVTVRVSGTDAITEFVYAEIAPGIDILAAGTYTVEILPTGTATVVISGVVTLEADKQYSLLAIGNGTDWNPELVALEDNPAAPPTGSANVRIGHYAPFAATGPATAVDICNDDTDQPVLPLVGVQYGQNSGWLALPVGIYDLSIAIAGTNCSSTALDLPAIALLGGKNYDLYAIGGANNWPVQYASITGLDVPAHVNIGHLAPFSTTVAGTAVDIRVNGTVAYTNVVFGKYVPDVVLPPAPTRVDILVHGTSTVALSRVFTLTSGMAYDVIAIGGANGQPLDFSTSVISKTAPAGQALITIGHLAPFAANANATAVDVCTDAGQIVLPNVKYPQVAANVPFPPGVYNLKIALAGTSCEAVALDLPPVALFAGKIYNLYVGGLNNSAFPLQQFSMTGLDLAALVNIGHFAPFSTTVPGTAVDIRVNGAVVYTDVLYGKALPNVALAPVPTLVEILVAGTNTVALSDVFTLTEGAGYNLFAIGGANSQPLAFSVTPFSTTVPAGKALLTLGHLAPFAADVNATAVDICTDAGAALPGLTNIKYPQVAANLVLDPGPYNLKITIAGSNCTALALDLPRFRLFAGDIANGFAIGTLTDEYPLALASTTGLYTVEQFFPVIKLQAAGR